MSEPSKFVRVKRTVEFTLKQTLKRRTGGKVVTAGYAKKHPSKTTRSVVYTVKKTTRSRKAGQEVTPAYAKRYPKLVKKTTTYKTKSSVQVLRKGKKVPESYAKRFPHLVKQTEYIQIEERQPKFDPYLKRQTYGDWKITSKQKMNYYEQILKTKNLTSRSVADMFARNRVYNNIWQNDKGTIRITVNGMAEGRRIKEVVHVGYLKSVWYDKHNGYSKFKSYLLHKVLEALRRRKLRLSNPKEALERIKVLRGKLNEASTRLQSVPDFMYDSTMNQVKQISKLIRQTKQASQVTGATIRIEKLVPN